MTYKRVGELETKIRAKARNILQSYIDKAKGVDSKGNKKTFEDDMANAMLKIVKTEVNIQVQERLHGKK